MHDVIVIGAGPAGNGTALELARAGLNVVVVDYRDRVGDKLCTGLVSIECLEEFPADTPVVQREARVANVVAPSGRSTRIERETPQAYVIDRIEYVASIARQAVKAGASYRLRSTVLDIAVGDDRATVVCKGPEGSFQLQAKVIVLATGFGSSLTKQLGIGRPADYVMGAQAEVLAADMDEIEIRLGEGIAPGFFGWLVPTVPGKALIGLLSRSNPTDYLLGLARALQKDGRIGELSGKPKLWGIPLRQIDKTVADRVVVVGDAAGQVKPTTGGGIYYALLSSRIAASSVISALADGDVSARSLGAYEVQWKAVLADELEAGHKMRQLYERLSDWQLEQILRIVAANGFLRKLIARSDVSFDWHGRLAQQVLGLPSLLATLKPMGFLDLWRRLRAVGGRLREAGEVEPTTRPSDVGEASLVSEGDGRRQGFNQAMSLGDPER